MANICCYIYKNYNSCYDVDGTLRDEELWVTDFRGDEGDICQYAHKTNTSLTGYTPKYVLETENISRLKSIANKMGDFNFSEVDHKNKHFEMRLIRIQEMLGSAEKKVDSMNGRADFDKDEQIKIRYGLCRVEFLINEIMLWGGQGPSNESYLKKLAIDVLEDLPLILDPERKGYSFVREAEMMDTERVTEEIAGLLLLQKDSNPHLRDIALEISNKCAKCPRDIRVVTSILSARPPLIWQHYLNQVVLNLQNPAEHIISTIHLMPKQRQLLNYLSLFPLDYEFSKVELNLLSGAVEHTILSDSLSFDETIFSDSKLYKKTFSKSYFENLLGSEYFFECSKRDKAGVVLVYYKARVLMYEVVKHLARDEYRLLEKPTDQADSGIQHVSFMVDSSWEPPSWLYDAKQLKSLLFPPIKSSEVITIPNINVMFENLKALNALDLAMVNCRNCLNSIGELQHLRYLRLGVSSESLPQCISNLLFLKTLDLRHSGVRELPQDFHKLRRLNHLFTGGRLTDLPPMFGELKELQTLDVFILGQNNRLNALAALTQLSGMLKICFQKGHDPKHVWEDIDYGKYKYDILDGLKSVVVHKEDNHRITFIEDMKLDSLSFSWSSWNDEPEAGVYLDNDAFKFQLLKLPSTLRSLIVQGWKGVDFPCLISLSVLESLQILGLNALEWIEPSSFITGAYCQTLKYLVLANLPQLKGWLKLGKHYADLHTMQTTQISETGKPQVNPAISSSISTETVGFQERGILLSRKRFLDVDCQQAPQKMFNCLSELRISGCPKLMSMPLMPSLETLEVVNIHEKLLEHLLNAQLSSAASSASSPSCKLKKLNIHSVHELKSLSITISSLEVLTIRECKELVNVFVTHSNDSLKRLEVCGCNRLKEISGAFHTSSVLQELVIERCEELNWRDMKDGVDGSNGSLGARPNILRSFKLANITKSDLLLRGISCFAALEELSLCWLYNLSYFPDFMFEHLTQLRWLAFRSLPNLESLPKSVGHLSALQYVEVQYCPRLKQIPESFANLQSLQRLVIKECIFLKRRCQKPNGQDWSLIKHIADVHLQ